MAYANGELIDDRYEVLANIGEGGHGVVYKCEDHLLGGVVAIKFLHAEVANEPGFKTRLMREARALGALRGTSAVQILAMNRVEGGGMYLVMEYLQGRNLEAYTVEVEKFGGRISNDKILELIGPIVDTLEAAHEQKIIHRDIKPMNIFVLDSMARGPVRLLDFGLAKQLGGEALTQDGTVAGSPSYIAPEGWRGRPNEVDHRMDIYSLGVTVYRLLTGAVPFASKLPMEVLIAVTTAPRPNVTTVRDDLPKITDEVMKKALAIDPKDRYANVRGFWNALRSVLKK